MIAPAKFNYTVRQRAFALAFGLFTHALFVIAVSLMAAGLYTGLQIGRGPFHGMAALTANILLLAQFPLLHSFLLGDRGRKILKRIMPMQLGAPLATTTFAATASLQLILFFGGWSPMGTELWQPPAGIAMLMTALYAGSWLLLLQGMREAGVELQAGSLGWWSVWRNRAPAYPPLPLERPLHSIVRHPIYIAFALILWTSPAFTAEKFVLAVAWTVYCVVGSRIKERRLARFHGEVYRDYMKRVPFWIPGKRSRPEVEERDLDAEVIIVGGGPVGLLLANLLGKTGRRVVLVESSSGEVRRSMAIGITPPSLELLASLDLDRAFITRGIRIENAFVHEEREQAGCLRLASASDDYPYILSLPQSETVQLLRENLNRYPSVSVLAHCRAAGIDQDDTGVNVEIRGKDEASSQTLRAALVTACDGSKSEIAEWLGIGKSFHAYAPVFMMGDFRDESGLGEEAHLFFGAERPIESFPLPGERRRWIVRCGWRDRIDLRESLATVVTRLSGIAVRDEDQLDASRFQPQRKLARAFYRGRVALCGDAAHVMSPIGGQGMNTGFGDAAFLANAYGAILDGRGSVAAWMRQYESSRKHAFRLAAARAAAGMTLGVARGRIASSLRRFLVRALLERGSSHQLIQRWFTMRSLPDVQQQYTRATRLIERELTST